MITLSKITDGMFLVSFYDRRIGRAVRGECGEYFFQASREINPIMNVNALLVIASKMYNLQKIDEAENG